MHINSPPYPTHSLEVERRLSIIETIQRERAHANEARLAAMDGRISGLERTIQILIYAVAAIASSKSGDLASLLIGALQK